MSFQTAFFFCSHYAIISGFTLICYGIGRKLASHVNYRGAGEQFVFCTSLGLGIVSYLVFLLGLLHLLYRAILVGSAFAILLACKSVWKTEGRDIIRGGKLISNKARAFAAGLFSLAFLLLVFLLALYPPTQPDATSYHLAAAKIYAQAHALVYTPYLRFPIFPQLNELLFSAMLVLSDDLSAQMVHCLMAILVAIGVYAWGRRISNPSVGLLASGLWLFNPQVVWLASSAYVDIGLTLFTTLAFYAFSNWLSERSNSWLILSAIMFGYGAASKYLALFPILCCFGLLCYFAARQRKWQDVVAFAAVVGSIAAPWYLRSLYYTGNPFWPYFGGIFGYGPWSRADYLSQLQEQLSYGMGKNLRALLLLPWNLAFNGAIFNQARDPFSPIYLFLLPLALFAALRDIYVRALLFVVSLYTLFWFSSVQVGRYLLLVVPLLSLAIAIALGRFFSWLPPLMTRGRMGAVTAATLLAFAGVAWPRVAGILPKQRPPITREDRRNYLAEKLPSYASFDFLNRRGGRNYSVYALGGSNMAYFSNGRFMGDWFGPARYTQVLAADSDPQALYTVLKDLGAQYFLLDLDSFPLEQFVGSSFLTNIANHLKLVNASPRTLLFEVLDDPPSCAFGPELIKNSGLENTSNGKVEQWTLIGKPQVDSSAHFSHRGTTAIASKVDDYLFQRVAIQPGRLYILSNFSRSTDKTSVAHLQINWLNVNLDKTVDIAIRGVPETSRWEQHGMAVSAPSNAFWADVYGSMAGSGPVWFDDFSFNEIVCEK